VFVVDSNILIYAVNNSAAEHPRSRALVEGWRRGGHPWFITWGIAYEFMRVTTHKHMPSPLQSGREAWGFIESLQSGGLKVLLETDQHQEILSRTLDQFPALRGSILHDVHTAVLMREHGVRRIYSRDTDFHKLPFLDVIDPLRSDWTTAEALAEYGGPSVRRRGRQTAPTPASLRPRRQRAPVR